MRLTLVTAGTLGDVLPLVHLGCALQQSGHEVQLATHAPFAERIEAHGLAAVRMAGDPGALFDGDAWRALALSPRRPREHARALHAGLGGLLDALDEDTLRDVLDGQDGLIFTPTASRSQWVAEQLGIPSLMASLTPLHRTGAFPQPVLAPGLHLTRYGNLLTYPVAERLLRQPFPEPLRPRARRAQGLSPVPLLDGRHGGWPPFPVLYGFSPVLVPRPADWPDHLHVTGEWAAASALGSSLPAEVEAFLDDGTPPVLITFGSMRPGFAHRVSSALAAGIAAAGVRVLVQSDWLELSGLEPSRCLITAQPMPHDLLLRRVAAVIHHGGAGTTHAGLRAGRPSWVCGFVFDQLFWGHRVFGLGAGPRPVPAASLNPETVLGALRTFEDPRVVRAARCAGEAMQAHNGVPTGAALAARLLDFDTANGCRQRRERASSHGQEVSRSSTGYDARGRRKMASVDETPRREGRDPLVTLPRVEDLPPLPPLPLAQRLYTNPRVRQAVPLAVGLRLAELRGELVWRRSAGGRAEALAEMHYLLDRSDRADEVTEIARRFAIENARRGELEWRYDIGRRIRLEGLEHLRAAQAVGRGLLIHFFHFGPYVHLATVLREHGVDVWAPISDYFYEPPVPGITGHKDRTHLRCLLAGCLPFPVSGTFQIIGELLARGEAVGMGSDLPGSLPARFLGRSILMSSGFAKLALASGAPIICATWERSRGRELLPVARLHPGIDPRAHETPASLQATVLGVHEPAVLAAPEALERPHARWKLADGEADPGVETTVGAGTAGTARDLA